MPDAMTIGDAAHATGLTRKAIRLYEARGLLPEPERTPAGYRTYSRPDVERLRFIGQARTLGLRLDEISQVIGLRQTGQAPCSSVRDLLDRHLADIDAAIGRLHELRAALIQTRTGCDASTEKLPDEVICPVIEH